MVPLSEALAWQRQYVEGAGAPTAGLILGAVLDDVQAGGPLTGLLPERVRFGDLPGLRVMATIHRLALDRQAPEVALSLPTLGGRPPGTTGERAAFGRLVVRTLLDHRDALAVHLARTPQTNEPGRATLLRCALSRLDPSRPVRLFEIGASAGLNLRADHLPGDPDLEAAPLPAIVERRGCDLDPVDVTTVEGRALLGSYVWVDDVARFQRLAAAMAVAQRVPAELDRMAAADFVGGLSLAPGTTTVLWHSAMWIYLSTDERLALDADVVALGECATADAPFVHVRWEWDPTGAPDAAFELTVTTWAGGPDDGEPRVLARGRSHGVAVTLTG